MLAPRKLEKMSVEDYFRFEESADVKHEYVNGQIFSMTGCTRAHNVISLNIAVALRSRLKGTGCIVHMADIKVKIEAINCFYYPDVLVDCGAFDKASLYTQTPSIIFEVLSGSTASTDRREKLVAYQRIKALNEYVMVHQSRKCIEIYRRDSEDSWTVQEAVDEQEVLLRACPDLTFKIALSEIYADIDFAPGPQLEVRENIEEYSW